MMRSCLLQFGLCVVVVPAFGFYIVPLPPKHMCTVGGSSNLQHANQRLPWTQLALSDAVSSGIGSDELEILFAEHADGGNTISKTSLQQVDLIQELLDDGDLLASELDEIWDKYTTDDDALDLQAFGKVYREIEDMFEEDEEDDNDDENVEDQSDETSSSASAPLLMEDAEARAELERIFAQLTENTNGRISKSALKAWEEIETLMVDGMLEDDEFDEVWDTTSKASDNNNEESLDLQGFLVFNTNLDELFDFDEELNEEEESDDDDAVEVGDDKTPEVESAESNNNNDDIKADTDSVEEPVEEEEAAEVSLFELLAKGSGLVSLTALSEWDELVEMLNDEDILQDEVEELYASSLKKSTDASALDETAFQALQAAIDDLFEDEEDSNEDNKAPAVEYVPPVSNAKSDLLRALTVLTNNDEEEERLPCGLECTEREDKLVLSLANRLLQEESSNILLQRNIETIDVAGTWELLYTSSSAMKFNKGLSGLGGSFPNGRFGGLKQILSGSALLPDVEYKERIEVNPSTASFDVTVDGNWELRQSTSLFTGENSIIMAIEPDRVMYGPTSTKADHWKSLGPTNMLDLVYLDDDLRIMRGSTSVDTILIFQRI